MWKCSFAMSCQLALLSIGMVCYRQSIRGGSTKHVDLGILQRGTPDMDGVPGVTQVPVPPFKR